MGPHAKHLDYFLFLDDLVYEPVLDIDSTGYGASQIADEALKPWRTSVGVSFDYGEQLLRFPFQAGGGKLCGILAGLIRVTQTILRPTTTQRRRADPQQGCSSPREWTRPCREWN